MRAVSTTRHKLRLPAGKLDLLLSACLVLLVIYGLAARPLVRFDRERIEVWALAGQIQVSGLYHYRNPLRVPAWVTMGVPFPVDAAHSPPTTFSISHSDRYGSLGAPILPMLRHHRVSFRLLFRGDEEKWLRVDYVQASRVSGGSYILRTTRAWGRPLDRGDYLLHLAPGAALVSSNYSLTPLAAPNTYGFSAAGFYPDADWNFRWRSEESAGGRQ